jgi:hypothetical protein
MRRRTSLRHDLAEIQCRLRRIAVQNDRAHERLAMKYHREQVETEDSGELDARYEGRIRRGST